MRLGIIGGSGLYEMDGLHAVRTIEMSTPFGAPSDVIIAGQLGMAEVFFLPRHGRGHRLLPSEINHRANIHALKSLGVECVVSVSAVGSLRENLRPRDVVLPDQYFDRTKGGAAHTFFGRGIVAHVSFGEPTCAVLRNALARVLNEAVAESEEDRGVRIVSGGTYVCMEGPAFSTKAESGVYRRLGFDVIGMTSLPEAKLCREAELCYQPMAMVTDYDCWHVAEEEVNVAMILETLRLNTRLAQRVLRKLAEHPPGARRCGCAGALRNAVVTDLARAPQETIEALRPILRPYLPRA